MKTDQMLTGEAPKESPRLIAFKPCPEPSGEIRTVLAQALQNLSDVVELCADETPIGSPHCIRCRAWLMCRRAAQ